MLLEDRLEVLLSTNGWPNATEEATQLAPLLDAARQLGPLSEAAPSPAFASSLQELLLSRAAALRNVDEAEDAEGYADTLIVPLTENVHHLAPQPTTPRRHRGNETSTRHSAPWWPIAVAAMLCLVFGGVFFAARQTSSPANKVQAHLSHADNALKSYDALVSANADDADLANALATLLSEQRAATQSLSAVPSGSDYNQLAAQLSDFTQRARTDLHAALAHLDWNSRLQATTALGRLGEQVLTVSTARISHDDDDIHSVPWGIQVEGSGFTSGAILLFGGEPGGILESITPTQFVAEWTSGTPPRNVNVGVQNPDGTAAETSNVRFQSDDGSNNDDTSSP